MSEQLLLDLEPHKLEGFIPGVANSKALEAILAYDRVAIIGPALSGKTEIAKATARRIGGCVLSHSQDVLDYLEAGKAFHVCVDDVDKFDDEGVLFHLYNHQKSAGLRFLTFATAWKAQWRFQLPDLKSRLETLPEAKIAPPDDGLVVALMVKWLYERGLQPRPKMVDYVAKRIERDYEKIYWFVCEMDKIIGQTRGKPTRKLAKEILGIGL